MTWLTGGHLKYLTFFGIVWLISSKWNVLIKNTNAFCNYVVMKNWNMLAFWQHISSQLFVSSNIFFWSQVLPGCWRSSDNRKYVFEVLFVFSWIFVVLSEIYDEQNNNSNSNTKVALLHGCFFHVFKNLYRWYQIARNICSNCT